MGTTVPLSVDCRIGLLMTTRVVHTGAPTDRPSRVFASTTSSPVSHVCHLSSRSSYRTHSYAHVQRCRHGRFVSLLAVSFFLSVCACVYFVSLTALEMRFTSCLPSPFSFISLLPLLTFALCLCGVACFHRGGGGSPGALAGFVDVDVDDCCPPFGDGEGGEGFFDSVFGFVSSFSG